MRGIAGTAGTWSDMIAPTDVLHSSCWDLRGPCAKLGNPASHMARAASTCNYDNMRGSSCLHIVSAHPTSKRATQACRRTNAVAVGPVNMMCKLTLTLTNANANFFSSPARSHTDRVARRNCMPQLRASSFRAPHKTQLHAATAASCKPQLRLSTYFGKTKQ